MNSGAEEDSFIPPSRDQRQKFSRSSWSRAAMSVPAAARKASGLSGPVFSTCPTIMPPTPTLSRAAFFLSEASSSIFRLSPLRPVGAEAAVITISRPAREAVYSIFIVGSQSGFSGRDGM